MKRLSVIIIIIVIGLCLSGYFYISVRSKTFNRATAISKTTDSTESKPLINFEPLLGNKLKKLINEGSHGLYDLSFENLKLDLPQSKVVLFNARLIPNTKALQSLDSSRKAPDDVFKISLRHINITGINVKDLIFNKTIDLDLLSVSNPVIEVYHKTRAYNKTPATDSETLYQRLTTDMKRIGIKKIDIEHCTFINYNLDKKNSITHLNDASMHFTDLLIDSTTQYNNNRFLFTKDAVLTFRNYVLRTADSLYLFKMGTIVVSAVKKSITATDVSLQPRLSKEAFVKKVKVDKERYALTIPSLTFNNVNWWEITNERDFSVDELVMNNAQFEAYLDRSLPPSPPNFQNFPHQQLMQLPMPVNVKKLKINNLTVTYQEYSPSSKKTGTIYFNNVNGTIQNITNIKEQIKKNDIAHITAAGNFMHHIPMKSVFTLNLAKAKTGDFSSDIQIGGFDATSLNVIAAPMGMFTVKEGIVKSVTTHVEGNSHNSNGKVTILYNNFSVTPLKLDANNPGEFKKKKVTGFIANTFIIKNNNPAPNEEPRSPDCTFTKQGDQSFFSLIWKTILVGALKTAGAPEKLAH